MEINNEKFVLNFTVKGMLKEFVRLQLFDCDGTLLLTDYEKISLRLEKGLYKLHIFSNEKLEQLSIVLDRDYHKVWKNKGTYSVIDNDFLPSNHGYYADRSRYWSIHPTVELPKAVGSYYDDDERSSVFIFFRYPSKGTKEQQRSVAQSMGWRFSLLDSLGKLIFSLKEGFIREDKQEGWMAFHAVLSPGIYFLVYNGNGGNTREIPLYVFPGWQTQLLMMFKRTPIFQTTRIQLVRPGYDGNFVQQDNLELDTLMRNMQNGNYYIPSYLIDKMASNKWDNPMLGIVVCYAYLLGNDRKWDDLFRTVIRNLQERILGDDSAPDLQVIRLLAASHFNEVLPRMELREPCMLMAGMRAVLRLSIEAEDKVFIGGLAEKIVQYMQNDMEWTSYLPLDNHLVSEGPDAIRYLNYYARPPRIDFMTPDEMGFSTGLEYLDRDFGLPPQGEKFDLKKDWISQSIVQQLSSEIANQISLTDLAYQYRISPAMVAKRIRQLRDLQRSDSNQFSAQMDIDSNSQQLRILGDNLVSILKGSNDNRRFNGS